MNPERRDGLLKEERQKMVLKKLSIEGKVVASKLALELGVSEDTVRRDLLELDEKGKLTRVYGGALPVAQPVVDYLERENRDVERKQRMAVKALEFIEKDQLLAVDGSSANLIFVRSLPDDLPLTLITNSYQIAQACSRKAIDIILIGGQLLKHTMTIVGDVAAEQVRLYHPDICFVGTYAIHPEYGLTIPYQAEVGVKRNLVESAGRVVSFINPEKFNTVSRYHICGIESFTTLITDENVSQETLSEYRKRGLECI